MILHTTKDNKAFTIKNDISEPNNTVNFILEELLTLSSNSEFIKSSTPHKTNKNIRKTKQLYQPCKKPFLVINDLDEEKSED